MLPLMLFVATCLSTFWVGAANWRPQLIESPDVHVADGDAPTGSKG